MKEIHAEHLDFAALNREIRAAEGDCRIVGCLGQRFIATGSRNKRIHICGTPGNALGAYLDGSVITVDGNGQDAVGDTMNDGKIILYGNVGDAVGYAMRGGKIFVKGNAGYRAGIHMKEYREKIPVMVIGGHTGSFLGEYQAGGRIIVLGLCGDQAPIVSNFPGTGMHGGKMFLRSDCQRITFPKQVSVRAANQDDLAEILPELAEFCDLFGYNLHRVLDSPFTLVVPDSKNPYKQMYVTN